MEIKEEFYLEQRLRYRVQGGVFEINTEDACAILNLPDCKSLSPSSLVFVPTNIVIATAYERKNLGFYNWLIDTFPSRQKRGLDQSRI